MSEAKTIGVHHVGLTVPSIAETRRFFIEHLGFEQVGEKPAYPAVFVSDGTVMLTLWQARDPSAANAFDRRENIGLHHIALRARGGYEGLDALHADLSTHPEVEIEFAPEPLGGSGARHMMCLIPGGIRLELIVVPE